MESFAHRWVRPRPLRALAGVEVADHFDHEGPFAGRCRWPVALAGARFQLRAAHGPPCGHPSQKKKRRARELFDSNYSLRRTRCAD